MAFNNSGSLRYGVAPGRGPSDHGGEAATATAEPVADERHEPHRVRPTSWGRPDLGVAIALFVLGLIARHGSLPTHGLIYDDAWVTIGASKAGLGQLLNVSVNHPGFVMLLKGWARIATPRATWMAAPAYVVGAAAASVLYLVLRRWRIDWPVSLLLSALVVVAPIHVQYSGRVKPYVMEGIVILIIASLLPRLARRRWDWTTAAIWVGAALLLSTFTVFMMMIVAVAGVVLAVHPRGDGVRRWVALAVQGLVSVLYLQLVQAQFDSAKVARDWETTYDSYIEITGSPLHMAREIGAHVARLGGVIIGGGTTITLLVALLAFAGLAWESRRGHRRIQAQFLLALPVLAFFGALANQIPFGPKPGPGWVYPGNRASLWLIPSLAVGLAFSLDAAARQIRRHARVALAPAAVVMTVLAVVTIGIKVGDARRYPNPGSESAQQFVARSTGPDDVVILMANASWTYAAVPGVDLQLFTNAKSYNGFKPLFASPEVWSQDGLAAWNGTPAQMSARTAHAHRVLIVNGYVGVLDDEKVLLEGGLQVLGYKHNKTMRAGTYAVQVWERPAS